MSGRLPFEDPSPLPSLQRNPQVQSERSVCGGGDLGRTYQRRLSCKLALIINDSRVEPAELKRVTQPALVFAVAVHLLRPMC